MSGHSLADSAGGISRAQVGTLACLWQAGIFGCGQTGCLCWVRCAGKESGTWHESISKRGNPYAKNSFKWHGDSRYPERTKHIEQKEK